jgi:hypothetical protein
LGEGGDAGDGEGAVGVGGWGTRLADRARFIVAWAVGVW